MRSRLKYMMISIGCLVACVIIAVTLTEHLFIRGFLGDVLVVIFIYCGIKVIADIKAIILSLVVLVFAYLVEVLQLFNFIELIGLKNNQYARIIFGTTFDFRDLMAYFIGVTIICLIDMKILTHKRVNDIQEKDNKPLV